MPSYLDSRTLSTETEMIMDEKSKMIYDPRNLTIFQKIKYNPVFLKVRPDLSREDSYEWSNKFVMAEESIMQLGTLLQSNIAAFRIRFGNRYTEYTSEASDQLYKFQLTRMQRKETSRVGSPEEIQMKINWYDKIMDKVQGYELLYPINEFTYEGQAQEKSINVKHRQDILKEKFLREMGVDYSILK